jgi:hypothetical protein
MKKIKILLGLLLILCSASAGAQVLKGSYFLDHSVNRHKMNPAFAPRANYFQLPVLGNTGMGMYTNLDLTSFTTPLDNGKLGTFLHPSVSVDDFDRMMPGHPHFDMDFSTTLLSFGFYTKRKSFWTFELDTRAMLDVDLPRDIFVFMKKGSGTSGESFNIGNLNAYLTAGVQASLGYSRDIMKGLRAGIKLRAIAPIGYAGLNLENMRLNTSEDKWSITTEGYAYAAVNGLDMNLPEGEKTPEMAFNISNTLNNGVVAGYGFSVDLGAEYKLQIGSIFDGLAVSAAVTDLGGIFYKKDVVSAFKTSGKVEWAGFQDVSVLDEIAFEESVNELVDNLGGLVNLSEMKAGNSFSRSTMPRFYVGVEQPFLWRTMSVGLLYSARVSHSYTRHELTASYNLNPCKWFALGLNYSFLNTGGTIGWIFELTPKAGPTFYIGGDYLTMEFVKAPILEDMLGEFPLQLPAQGLTTWVIPTSMRLNLNFGFAFNLGSKYANPKKEKKNK